MSLVYRRVDKVLSGNAAGEVCEGDCLLLETAAEPARGELALMLAAVRPGDLAVPSGDSPTRKLCSLKNRHRDCRVVRRKGRVYVINKTQRRFKARQG